MTNCCKFSGKWMMSAAAIVTVMMASSRAHATVELTVEIEPTRAQVGEPVNIRYSVRLRDQGGVQVMPLNFGSLELMSDPAPPQIPTMWGAGIGFSVDTASEYLVRATRPGRYVITGGRAIDPRTNRVIAQAAPVTLIVGDPGDAGEDPKIDAAAQNIPVDPDAPPAGDLTGAYFDQAGFYRVGVDRSRVYLGQQITYRLWVYSASNDTGCELTTEPTFPGFWNEVAFAPSRECAQRWFSQSVSGRFMAIGLTRKVLLFPTQTGTLSFGAVAGAVQVMSGGMFRSMQRVESRTPPVEVIVMEPPVAGRPEGYVPGTIGPVALEATIDRESCSTGETATISVRARSDGSLSAARLLLDLHVDGARVRTTDGRTELHPLPDGRVESVRVTEILVVPEREGSIAIGELRMPYFDPSTERYGVASVVAPVVRATGEAVQREAQRPEQQDPAMVLRRLSDRPSMRSYSTWFFSANRALGFALAPSMLLSLTWLGLQLRRLLSGRRVEQQEALKRDPGALMAQARALLAQDSKGACAIASKALESAISESVQNDEENQEVQSAIVAAREALSAVRFAGTGDASATLALVESAIHAVEGASG